MPPPLVGGGIKRCFCLTSDVCLSATYIGTKSKTEAQEDQNWHRSSPYVTVTRTPLSRSRSPGRFAHRRFGASAGCSGGHENVLAVGNCCYVAVCSAAEGASAPTGGAEGRRHTVAAARLQLFILTSPSSGLVCMIMICRNARQALRPRTASRARDVGRGPTVYRHNNLYLCLQNGHLGAKTLLKRRRLKIW